MKRKTIPLISLGFSLFLLVMLSLGTMGFQRPAGLPARPTKTPKRAPLRTPSPRPDDNAFSLNELNYIGGMGGGPDVCWLEVLPQDLGSLPAILFLDATTALAQSQGQEYLCIYGFPDRSPVAMSIYAPDGRLISSFQLVPRLSEDYRITSAGVGVAFGSDLPRGAWRVTAQNGGFTIEQIINLGGPGKPKITLGHLLPGGSIDPLDPRRALPFAGGEDILIAGFNLPPNRSLPVGLFLEEASRLKPIKGSVVRTDRQGAFSIRFRIDGSFPLTTPHKYFVVPITDPAKRDVLLGQDPFTVFEASYRPCSGSPPTLQSIGKNAWVVEGPPNNIRSKPGLRSPLLGQANPDTLLNILEGPRCADNLTWWKVRLMKSGLVGWTVEGDSHGYWIR